jgi:uncharacterized RmlC-like cupin family protein
MPETKGKLQIVRPSELSADTGQSAGALRLSAIDGQSTGANQIWLGRVSNEPGHRSVPHHHGEAETAGYLMKGEARIYFGDGYREYVDVEEGDFVFVPPYLPHIEVNRSNEKELVWLTARTPANIVVNLDNADPRD